jgi:hypothetical protein
LSESGNLFSSALLYVVLSIWGVSLVVFLGVWLFVLGQTQDFHINLLMFSVLVAGAVPLAVIVLRLRGENLVFGTTAIAGLILLWEAVLVGILLFWGVLVMTSTHMPPQRRHR